MSFQVGDIVEVEFDDGSRIQGHVLLISKHFKDVIGAVFPVDGGTFDVQYTNVKAAKHYGWKIVGHRELTKDDIDKTKRIVAGDVFVGDQVMRVATDQDWNSLPRMLVKGMPIVFDELKMIASDRNTN